MPDEEIYQKFIEYMSHPIWEFTESEHKMPMIKALISPEEAEFLTGFPKKNTSIEEIADLKDMDAAELETKIKALCRKGLVYEAIHEDSSRYRLWSASEMFLRAVFWSGKGEDHARRLAPHATRYYMDGWYDQKKLMPHPDLRALPINETIEGGTEILPFEDVLKVIDNYEYYTVSHCVCRERHRLDPDYVDSPFPSEVCLHFDELGRYCVENDMGREITKEETIQILKQAADAGLVHGLANHQDKPDTL